MFYRTSKKCTEMEQNIQEKCENLHQNKSTKIRKANRFQEEIMYLKDVATNKKKINSFEL